MKKCRCILEAESEGLRKALRWIVVESGSKQPSWWTPEWYTDTFDAERRRAINEVAKHALEMKYIKG